MDVDEEDAVDGGVTKFVPDEDDAVGGVCGYIALFDGVMTN